MIASDVKALNEIIVHKENGLLFKVKDEKDLAENSNKLFLESELKRQLVSGGHENVKKLSFEDYSIRLSEFYNELL